MIKKLLCLALVPALVLGYFTLERTLHRDQRSRVLGRVVDARGLGTLTILSRTHLLDRVYPSMRGPYENQEGLFLAAEDPEGLYWVTGVELEVVDQDGAAPISPEFFCHANLTLGARDNDPGIHNAALGGATHLDWRLFTLVPGRLSVQLPEGFGIPVRGGEPLDFLGMSLNLVERDHDVRARFRTRVTYVAEAGTSEPMKPLFRRAIYGYEPLGVAAEGTACVGGSHPGEACGPFRGETASKHGFVESVGEGRTIHWMVAPGHYESRTDVTDQLALPFDTTVHYATGHLHPHGVSLTLRDVTEDRTLLEIRSRDWDDRLGVAHMDEDSIPEGMPLRQDHRYELVTVYDNTTDSDIDAMSILYLYCLDRDPAVQSAGLID